MTESLDGKQLLLGEVKWTETAVSEKALRQAGEELKAKGIPTTLKGKGHQIVHALFVPRAPSGRRSRQDAHIIDAREVVACLR